MHDCHNSFKATVVQKYQSLPLSYITKEVIIVRLCVVNIAGVCYVVLEPVVFTLCGSGGEGQAGCVCVSQQWFM